MVTGGYCDANVRVPGSGIHFIHLLPTVASAFDRTTAVATSPNAHIGTLPPCLSKCAVLEEASSHARCRAASRRQEIGRCKLLLQSSGGGLSTRRKGFWPCHAVKAAEFAALSRLPSGAS